MISLDSETSGLDIRHGATVFFVTVCQEDGTQLYWEWAVDPITRKVTPPQDDLADIREIIEATDRIVCQNGKFDYSALKSLDPSLVNGWDWGKCQDTLIAGHLLASNAPHNLTDMAMHYLGADILPLEKRLEEAVQAARRLCRTRLKDWRIADKGLAEMPSAKEKTWRYDMWLPRAVFDRLGKQGLRDITGKDLSHWETALADYSNADSAVTLALWGVMEKELHRRGLWKIYQERMRVVPVAVRIEEAGVTISRSRLSKLVVDFTNASEAAEAVCLNLARGMGYNLHMPKGGRNNSLNDFMFGPPVEVDGVVNETIREKCSNCLCLPIVKRTEKGNPSMDKYALDEYLASLPERSKELLFIQKLLDKRSRDTALSYLESYQKFWISLNGKTSDWLRLHPSVNITGTDTLRKSSSNPNATQISKKEVTCTACHGEGCQRCDGKGIQKLNLRYAFGPTTSREWWSLDAKNIELRIPAYLSGEQEMIALFERPNDPPFYGSNHLLNFSIVYPDIWQKEIAAVGIDKVGPHCKKKYASTYYVWGKNGGLGIQYQAGRETADRAFHRAGSYDKIKARFRKLEVLNQQCVRHAEKYGYVESLPDRTVDPERGYPLLCTRTERGGILPTVPLNYKIQGTACWIITKGEVRCQEQLDTWRKEDGFDGHIVLDVHDELVFDFPTGKIHPSQEVGKAESGWYANGERARSNLWRIRILQKLIEQCALDLIPPIPIPVGVEYHAESWGEGVTL